ncbi:MAG: 50S ribosomal protein L21 [Coriobacteriia bacterium]
MYAIVKTGGKQLVVEKDTVAVVEKIDAPVGESVTLPAIFVADGDTVLYGEAADAAVVTAVVMEHFLGEKQVVVKFKKRKGYKRLKGHRQPQTALLITDVVLGAPKKAAAKKAEKAVEAPATEVAVAEKPAASKAEAPAAADKPAAKRPAAPKAEAAAAPAAEAKPAAKKPAAKKPAVPKAEAAAEDKPVAKKPAARKPAAKKADEAEAPKE